jgi:hypothetical protein
VVTDDICDIPDCGRPTTNAFVCDPCADGFANDLKALIDWLDDDLETCISGAKGVRYSNGAPRGGGDPGLRVNWRATELYRQLQRALCDAVDHCIEAKVRHVATTDTDPSRTITAMASWLCWRIDGLALDPAGPRHVAAIGGLVDKAKAVAAWEPPERRFLGPCEICGQGHVYAEDEALEAICDRCETAFAADLRRVDMLKTMDQMLFDAAEIANLSTYLGLRKDREKVRKQVNLWHHRGIIEAKSGDGEESKFLLGDVRHRLEAQNEGVTKTTAC